MKKTKLALAITATIFTSSAIATNGTNMTGVGTQANALGGTGVAAFYGAENVIINPGIIGKSKGTAFTFGGTVFMPNVKNDGSNPAAASSSSAANLNLIPSVSLVSRIDDNWTFGIGMFGTSGMGVDYRESSAPGVFNAQSQLQIMRFVPTLAYNESNFGIGLSPVIQYGNLDLNYKTDITGDSVPDQIGSGASSDLGYGFDLGGYFDINKNTTVALSYQSAINMKYANQLSAASVPFAAPAAGGLNPSGLALTALFGDELEQPAEIKAGISHEMGQYTLTADVKQVKWADAKGYKDFGWQDQNVIALGVKYTDKNYWLGLGYNKADNPIKPLANTTTVAGAGITNMFNNVFFPATTEQHISFGGGYKLNKTTTIEGSVVMAPEVTSAVDISGAAAAGTINTTTHSQLSYNLSVSYNF